MYCKHCGRELMGEGEICIDCANALYNQSNTPTPNQPQNKKSSKLITILIVCVAAILLVLGSLTALFLIKGISKGGNDTYSDKIEVLLKDDVYGEWNSVTGDDEHSVTIFENGKIAFASEKEQYEVKYRVISNKRLFASFNDDMEYEFEYVKGMLVRYEDSIADGYTYKKETVSKKPVTENNNETEIEDDSINNEINSSKTDENSKTEEDSQNATTTQKDIPYDLDKIKASISVWEKFENYGAGCKLSNEEVPQEVFDCLDKNQKDWVFELSAADCCKSIAQAKAHLLHYFSSELIVNFNNESFVEYKGKLYIAMPAKGFVEYEKDITESDVVREAYNKVSVTTKLYNSGGEFDSMVRFEYEYINGSYILVNQIIQN